MYSRNNFKATKKLNQIKFLTFCKKIKKQIIQIQCNQ